MTAIAGLVHDGHVWMGADSAGVAGLQLTLRADEKVFRNGEFLFGFTSSFRMGQLLRYSFIPPVPNEGEDTYRFMVTEFIGAVRKCLREGGYATKDKDVETAGVFLVAFRGRLFYVGEDYQVGESLDSYDACGSGGDLIRASLFSTKMISDPRTRMRLALEAAEHHNAGVRGPFLIEEL